MKIGLIDVDSHNFPNLALMKISAWHKAQGDEVEWYSPMFSGHMDRVYLSKVFSFSPDYPYYIDADEVIDMHDKPAKAFAKKPNSSMAVGFKYLKEGKIDSFASAGNTGAMLVGTMYSVGVINGIMRPCLAALVPKVDGGVTLLTDVGVNPDAKPEMLVQFAILGSVYAKTALGMENPKVGLANIGEEEEKGNAQTQAAHALMKENNSFEFFGNAEPVEIFKNNVDVVVCDGFVGNMLMKHTEALARVFAKRGLVDEYVARFNYEIYGGLPLLGANSIVLIGHGISNAKAIKSMIFQSKNIYETNLIGQLKETLSVN